MLKEVLVPDIGEYHDVDVIEVLVKVGDTIAPEASLLSLETDKATMEVPAPFGGVVQAILVKAGDKVSQGTLILKVKSADTASAEVPVVPIAPAQTPEQPTASIQVPAQTQVSAAEPSPQPTHASPMVRRLAREMGVNLERISATGPKGRITQEDLTQHVQSRLSSNASASGTESGLGLIPDPHVDFAKFGPVQSQPLSRIKKLSGANLHRNWVKIPHITFFEDADITDLEAFRVEKKLAAEKLGVKVTPVAFIVKAIAKALIEFPEMNASLSPNGENLILKKYVHIGVAVDTPNGLVVPVILNADQKGIYEIAKDLSELAKKGREGKLKPTDMQGGCFTISSLGNVGTHGFTPIVNMPEVGILGVSKASMKPVYDGAHGFIPRLMLPLSLSVDHRVIDGAQAGAFIVRVTSYLSDLRELLL